MVVCALLALAGVSAGAAPPGDAGFRPDTVLVAFKPRAAGVARLAAVQRLGLEVDARGASPFFARLRIPAALRARGAGVKSVIAALRRDPSVRLARPDVRVRIAALPNDPRFPDLWGLRNTGQTGGTLGADIHAEQAWDASTGGDGVIVAVIDTGMDYNHPDLRDNVLRDGSGRVVGYDFVNEDTDPMDDHGHGTHVSGTIGARGNNGVGVVGVCHTVRLMPLKFLDHEGSGYLSDAVRAIDFARERKAKVLSNSWGGGGPEPLLLEAIQRARAAGILFVAAAGNESSDNDQLPAYPASFNQQCDNVLSVAATDASDALPFFSNYGRHTVDLAAPGDGILSTLPGGLYGSASGTSMATPHVSGTAALVLARFPGITLPDLTARLLDGVDHPATLDGRVRTGRLNAAKALEVDAVPPDAPGNLRLTHRGEGTLRVSWTAPGDDGMQGTASRFELRWSLAPIDDSSFADAAPVDGVPAPGAPGTRAAAILTSLAPGTPYYVAVRAVDNGANASPLAVLGPESTLPGTSTTLLRDDPDGPPQFTGPAPWTSQPDGTGGRMYLDSPGGPYAPGLDLPLTQRTAVQLEGGLPALTFHAQTDLDPGFDFLLVELSYDQGASWHTLQRLTGTEGWRRHRLVLAPFRGRSVRTRFRLVSDGDVQLDGVSLADIRIAAGESLATLMEDDVEGAPRFSGEHPWAVTTEASFSPTRSYTDSPGGLYEDFADASLTQVQPVALDTSDAQLSFWARLDLEADYDFLHVELSRDGGQLWQRLLSLTGASASGFYLVPLPAGLGDSVRVRFRLIADTTIGADGAWVDDIRITGERLVPVTPPEPPTALSGQAVSDTSVRLAWLDGSDDESAFEVERTPGPGGKSWERVALLPANTTAYQEQGLNTGAAYSYRVRAVNAAGASGYTGEVSITVQMPPAGRLQVDRLLRLGAVTMGQLRVKSLQVRNRSRLRALQVQVVPLAAPFRLVGSPGLFLLPPGGVRSLRIEFAPTSAGRQEGSLTLVTSDRTQPEVLIQLVGNGRTK